MTKKLFTIADVNKAGEPTISKEALDLLKAQASKVEDLEKANKELIGMKAKIADLEKENSKIADLEKVAIKLQDLEKAAAKKILLDTSDVIKGFNLFEESDVEDVAKHFVKHAGKASELILASLEKARTAIKTFGEKEHGSDLEGTTTDLTKSQMDVAKLGASVLDIIKSRKNEK
jgi:vacuolar-type H+-ATPase subunit I/STV1